MVLMLLGLMMTLIMGATWWVFSNTGKSEAIYGRCATMLECGILKYSWVV